MSPSPEILTLTGNLLCERTQDFADWSVGRTQRAVRESFQVGGKGINVTKMLHRLRAPTTALCFAGGATGAECEAWLRAQPFRHHIFPTLAATRVGLVVRGGRHAETTFFGPDAAPDSAAIRACVEFLDAQAPSQVLGVCGSLPGWSGPDFDPLRDALERWRKRGTLAADTYGPPLAWFAAQPLALVKINAGELRTLFPGEPASATTESLLRTAVARWPAARWIVTDGGGPVWFCERGGTPASVNPPVVVEVSATGSGDVLFACVLDTLFRRGATLADSVAGALPFAAANAAHPGIAEFPDL